MIRVQFFYYFYCIIILVIKFTKYSKKRWVCEQIEDLYKVIRRKITVHIMLVCNHYSFPSLAVWKSVESLVSFFT